MKIIIVNVLKSKSTHYCGRPSYYKLKYGENCSTLGNPFLITKYENRDNVCDKYDEYFNNNISNNGNMINTLNNMVKYLEIGNDIKLGCFCTPKRCHCSTIKTYLESKNITKYNTFF